MSRQDAGLIPAALGELEEYLALSVPRWPQTHPKLSEAISHSLLAPGKRLRPRLVIEAAALGSPHPEAILAGAAAVEMLHCYSLIHDDLPAMDDDDLRRGLPSCHVAFGEDMAILAGDALQAMAFGKLAQAMELAAFEAGETVALLTMFADCAGPCNLVGGQAADLGGLACDQAIDGIRWIHERKTAALIKTSLLLGAALGRLDQEEARALGEAGTLIGFAFQTVDDVLDETTSTAELGKTAGKDRAQSKATLVSSLGAVAAGKKAEAWLQEACALLPPRAEQGTLASLFVSMVKRSR